MDREKAFDLVKKYIKNKNLIKHSLAVEAIMKEIAKELNNVKAKVRVRNYVMKRNGQLRDLCMILIMKALPKTLKIIL